MLQTLTDFIHKVTHGETLTIGGQKARWQKVAELTPGVMIAVPDGDGVSWDEIVSIKRLAPERVFDIEVEGTHNFVAGHMIETPMPKTAVYLSDEPLRGPPYNKIQSLLKNKWFGGIFAHNTYINGNVGIGTSSPGSALQVANNAVIGYGTGSTAAPTNGLAVQGNVGIGTVSPVAKLDTNGSAWLRGDGTGGLWVNSTAGGNVGIGTTGPGAKLNLVSSGAAVIPFNIDTETTSQHAIKIDVAASTGIVNLGGYNATDAFAYFKRDVAASGMQAPLMKLVENQANSDEAVLYIDNNGTGAGLIVDGGNVGIGTVGPTVNLEISKVRTGTDNVFILGTTGTGATNDTVGLSFVMPGSGGTQRTRAQIFGVSENTGRLGGIAFYTNTGTVAADSIGERVRIDAAGNLGIGTSGPASKLSVMGNAVIGSTYGFNKAGPTNGLAVEGNIGIGTTSPQQALDVVGRIRQSTWTADGDTAIYKDDPTGNLGVQASDIRLKKNLTAIRNPLDIVNAITGYMYTMLDEADGAKKRLGVIAQDLLPILPEATFSFTSDSGETYYGVHYEKLTALLIEAIKAQQTQIKGITSGIAQSITTSLLSAQKITADSLIISTDTVSIAGTSLKDFIIDTVKNSQLAINNGTINSPIVTTQQLTATSAQTNQLLTDIISPVSNESTGISVKLNDRQTFGIYNKEGSPSAVFDAQGNATISGTLYADRIVTKHGNFGDIQASTVSATYITNVTNVYQSTASATPHNDNVNTDFSFTPDASISALLAFLQAPDSNTQNVDLPKDKPIMINSRLYLSEDLTVLGNTSLGPTSVAGSLLVDGSIRISNSGIETLADTLYIQRNRTANLNILDGMLEVNIAGKVTINADLAVNGNATVNGNLVVQQDLHTNSIKPLAAGSDLVVDLTQSATDSATPSSILADGTTGSAVTGFGKLLIKGSAQLAGDLVASGSGTFSKLIIAGPVSNTASGNQNAVTGNATIGSATIPAYARTVTVGSTTITDKSLVYITPITSTNNNVIYVSSKTSGIGFTVTIDTPINKAIQFNWWIIN